MASFLVSVQALYFTSLTQPSPHTIFASSVERVCTDHQARRNSEAPASLTEISAEPEPERPTSVKLPYIFDSIPLR